MNRTLNCTIITPEKNIYEGDVNFAVVQAYNGEMGFLHDHAPLISELGVGEVRLMRGDSVEYVFIEGGVVEFHKNKMIILAEKAFTGEDLSEDSLNERLSQLEEKEFSNFSDEKVLVMLEKNGIKAKLKLINKINN